MFRLDKLPQTVLDEYKDKILDGLVGRINASKSLSISAKKVLLPICKKTRVDTRRLEALLISEPQQLVSLNQELETQLRTLNKNKRPSNAEILEIFNYDGLFNNGSKRLAFWLAKKIGRNTCTYCNRNYIFTVERNGGRNKHDRITRPFFDHYFPKSKYPLLSLSIYNLIPACNLCNSALKGSLDMDLQNYLHPYVHNPLEIDFSFKVDISEGQNEVEWKVKIDRKVGSKEDNTIKAFALDELYAMHNELEIKDLVHFFTAYPKGYISTLQEHLMGEALRPLTQMDVYRMLFGAELERDKLLDRPLSKMKYDILKDNDVI